MVIWVVFVVVCVHPVEFDPQTSHEMFGTRLLPIFRGSQLPSFFQKNTDETGNKTKDHKMAKKKKKGALIGFLSFLVVIILAPCNINIS